MISVFSRGFHHLSAFLSEPFMCFFDRDMDGYSRRCKFSLALAIWGFLHSNLIPIKSQSAQNYSNLTGFNSRVFHNLSAFYLSRFDDFLAEICA